MTSKAVSRRQHYTAEEIDRALSAAVYWDGNTRHAAAALKKQALDIARSTLDGWVRDKHRGRYLDLQKKLEPEIHARAAEQHQELVRENIETEQEILKRLKQEIPNLAARDLSTAGRNAAVAAGVHQDKSATLRGLGPNTPTVNIDMGGLIRSLAEKGTPLYDADSNRLTTEEAIARSESMAIEGTAEPLTEGTKDASSESETLTS